MVTKADNMCQSVPSSGLFRRTYLWRHIPPTFINRLSPVVIKSCPEGGSTVHIRTETNQQRARMASAKMPEGEETPTPGQEDQLAPSNDAMTLHDLHQRKYFALKQKCEQMQQVGACFSRVNSGISGDNRTALHITISTLILYSPLSRWLDTSTSS